MTRKKVKKSKKVSENQESFQVSDKQEFRPEQGPSKSLKQNLAKNKKSSRITCSNRDVDCILDNISLPDIPDPLLLEENHPSNTSIAETDLDDDELIGKSTVSLPSFIMNQFYSTLYPGEVRSLEEKRKRACESLSKVIANNTVSFFPDVLVTDDPRLSHLPRDGMENWNERKLDEIFRRWPDRCWMDIFNVTQAGYHYLQHQDGVPRCPHFDQIFEKYTDHFAKVFEDCC